MDLIYIRITPQYTNRNKREEKRRNIPSLIQRLFFFVDSVHDVLSSYLQYSCYRFLRYRYFGISFSEVSIELRIGSFGVHPGDPFPDKFPIPKTFSADDTFGLNDKSDPFDDAGPSDSNNNVKNSLDSAVTIPLKPLLIEKLTEQIKKNESSFIAFIPITTTESSRSMVSRKK